MHSNKQCNGAGTRKKLVTISSLKIDILHCLAKRSPTNTKTMSLDLGVHQSSISHAVKDLIREDLVARNDNGYMLTNIGRLHINIIDSFHNTMESIERQKEFLLGHDLNDIPVRLQMQVGMICSQKERLMDVDSSTPFGKQEYLTDILKKSKIIRGVSSFVSSEHAKAIIQAFKDGADVDLVITDRIIQTLKDEYAAIRKETSGGKSLKMHRINDVKLSLWITESNLFLGLHRLDGDYDFGNIITCSDADSIEWGQMLFRHYLEKTKSVDNLVLN